MRKNLLLTCLLTLIAAFGMAQTQWPIVLTTADGLPGEKIVRSYSYQSKTYELDEAVSALRFTVISTNTVDALTTSFDGYSNGYGTGFPFFSLSEFRIYDGAGNPIEYVASCNAVETNDGGGLEALSDNNVGTYLHTTYGRGPLPHAYHYIEFELAEPVTSFSFNWNTRSNHQKNLITYMGITPGTQFLPFPEQNFRLGKQVTSVDELAEEGALFVFRSNSTAEYIYPDFDRTGPVLGQVYMHSPCGGDETPNAAQLVYLTPDANVENGYKVSWLNNGHHMIKPELNGIWFQWTNDILNAGTVTFAPCDTVEGAFVMSMEDNAYLISYDAIGKMALVANDDEAKGNRTRPNTYNWNIYKASIKGSAIASQLQEVIDDAERRLNEVGKVEGYDEGEYDAIVSAVAEAKALVAKADVTAAEIFTTKKSLNLLTAAYAATTIWAYVDSIDYITAAVENGDIVVSEAPDWVEGSYNGAALDNLVTTSDAAMQVVDTYQSLADVDAAIASIYAAIDGFWAAKVANVKTLPFRVGTTEDGLPGTNINYVWIWESPMWLLNEETDAIRLTVFGTKSGRVCTNSDKPFVCINELEFYDASGIKIPLTEDNFMVNSIATEGLGIEGLCDGSYVQGDHFHSQWVPDEFYDGSEYFYLEVTFPEPINAFKYVQYGRGNGYDDVPTDFLIGHVGETVTPETVPFPDPYNAVLGEKITDVSQITDDGIYALQGLLNCAPEGNGEGFEKFYSTNIAYGTKIAAPCAFSIRKTGAEDGSFYIQSLADRSYWSQTIDNDGWGGNSTTINKAEAGKFIIAPMNRAKYGKEAYDNTFVVYMYNDTVMRDGTPHPYVVAQDWGDNIGYFSIDAFENNDWDGQGEWRIYKMTMDNPNLYWLKNAYAAAAAMGVEASPDPGYYSIASAGAFAAALEKAQKALETNDETTAKVAIPELEAAVLAAQTAEINPVVPGIYVFEAAYREEFIASTGSSKYMCTYFNDFEANNDYCTSEYSLYWSDAPEGNIATIHNRYKFQLISAANSDAVKIWLEDEVIDSTQAANAYFIKSVETGQYAGVNSERSKDIGLTDEAENPYIIRSQGAYVFDFWNPADSTFSMHLEYNGGGKGAGGDIVYWTGTDKASQWFLRKVTDAPVVDKNELAINNLTTAPGRSITLPVEMTNSEAVTAFQIDLELPEGVEFVSAVLNNSRKTASHTISTSVLANGKRRIIAYSNENKAFKLSEGTLLNINLDVAKEIENGDYAVKVSNIRLVKPDSKEILLDPISANITVKEVKGDANNDFDVTMGDVVAVANYILELFTSSFNIEAADINGDGEITMGDLVAIINIILYPEDYDYGRNAKRGVMAASGSALSMPDTRSTDEAVSVPVSLSSTMAYTAFQMDIELPEGAKLASATASERAAGHSVAWSCLPDGKMRVVAYSLDNEAFSGNAGELVALNIEAEGAVSGAISVENVRMVTPSGDEYAIGNCGSLLDINGTTGINGTEAGSLKVYTADGALIVESGKTMKAAVYSVSGKLVKTLDVAEGKNIYEALPAGTYVVAGVKVAIK